MCQKFEPFQTLDAFLHYEQKKLMLYFRRHILKPHVNIETAWQNIFQIQKQPNSWFHHYFPQTGAFNLLQE